MPDDGFSFKNMPEVQRAVRKTGQGIEKASEKGARDIASQLASAIRAAGAGTSRQAAAAARTVGSTGGTTPGVTVNHILFGGSEWGGSQPWFPPWRGVHGGRWFYATVKGRGKSLVEREWIGEIDRAIKRYWRN